MINDSGVFCYFVISFAFLCKTFADILLSLVRTRSAGHIRDIRRLVVAISRARLGLYIFGSKHLYSNAFELQQAFHRLFAQMPNQLALIPDERHKYGLPTLRRAAVFDDGDLGAAADLVPEEGDPERVAEMLATNAKFSKLAEAAGAVPGTPLDPRVAPKEAMAAGLVLVNNLVDMATLVQKMTQQALREWQEDVEVRRRWEEEQAELRAAQEEQERLVKAQQEAIKRDREEEARLLTEAERLERDAERAELLMQAVEAGAEREAQDVREAAEAELSKA